MDKSLLTAFPFLAVLTPFLLFFGQIKALIGKFFSLFVVRVEMVGDSSTAFNYYLQEHGKRWSLGEYKYSAVEDYSQPDKKRIAVGIEEIAKSPQLVRFGKTLVLVQDKKGGDKDGVWAGKKTVIHYIRGTFKHEEVLIKALDKFNSRAENGRFTVVYYTGEGNKTLVPRAGSDSPMSKFHDEDAPPFEIYKSNRILKYSREQLGNTQSANSLTLGYVFCKEAKKLLADCERWFDSENWYREHGILWRRGTLIGGRPGSGKTSLVRKICQKLDIPMYVFDLASMSNKEFLNNWQDCQNSTPCAVLFDDFDKVFDKQVNIAGDNGGGLSFEALLSALSGAQPVEGMLVFCTVSDMSKIDDTLAVSQNGVASRPGRIDDIIEINDMDEESRTELAKKLFSNSDIDISTVVSAGQGMTAAQFNNYCSNLALDKWWNK